MSPPHAAAYAVAVADVTCVDGSVLSVLPEAVLDRDDVPYEMALRLLRDGEPFGVVGERCGFFLATVAARLARATAAAGPVADDQMSVTWVDPRIASRPAPWRPACGPGRPTTICRATRPGLS